MPTMNLSGNRKNLESIIRMLEERNPKLKEKRHKEGVFFSDEEAI